MKKKIVIGLIALSLVLGAAGAKWLFWPGIEETDRQMQGAAELDEVEAEEGDLSMSIEEILSAVCEHEVSTYQCPTCRFEVGVVKVEASLLKGSQSRGNGLVRIAPVSKGIIDTVMNVTGEVQLNENAAAHISPRIPGIIRSVQVDIGARVEKDDSLFEIDSVELGQALSDYEKNRALKELSLRNFEREKSLFERKIASERDMIDAQMTYEQYQTELKAAKQKLCVLGLREEEIATESHCTRQISAGRLPVRAPFDGMIIEKHAVVGELVEPGSDVMLLADLSTVWVWADIYERDLAQLIESEDRGRIPVEVFVHAYPGRAFKGRIDYMGATMDEMTRTVKVRATVCNKEGLLRPGMFCEIRVLVASSEEVLSVPKAALLSDEGHDFIFKHLKEDFYVRRPVKKGRDFDEGVEILGGLEPGERIVAEGAFILKSDVLRSKMGAGCAD